MSEKTSGPYIEIEKQVSVVTEKLNLQSPKNPDLTTLNQYALDLVNKDRKDNGLPPVVLSDLGSAQNHADDELKNNYFSHWNSDGVKPYVTYTELGGKNDMAENDFYKYSYCQGVICFENNFDPYNVIKEGEYEMMYNDSQSNWGHRNNILEPHHTHVNFGIAYNHQRFYFVEHFETNLISWDTLKLNGNQLTMNGHYPTGYSLYNMDIFEDPSPQSLTGKELDNSSPYNKGFYDQGNLVGVAVSRPSDNSYYVECSAGKIQLDLSGGEKKCAEYTMYDNSGVPNTINMVVDLSKWLSQNGSLHTLYVTLLDKNGNQVEATSITLEDLK